MGTPIAYVGLHKFNKTKNDFSLINSVPSDTSVYALYEDKDIYRKKY